jgi:hypothetical protein
MYTHTHTARNALFHHRLHHALYVLQSHKVHQLCNGRRYHVVPGFVLREHREHGRKGVHLQQVPVVEVVLHGKALPKEPNATWLSQENEHSKPASGNQL